MGKWRAFWEELEQGADAHQRELVETQRRLLQLARTRAPLKFHGAAPTGVWSCTVEVPGEGDVHVSAMSGRELVARVELLLAPAEGRA